MMKHYKNFKTYKHEGHEGILWAKDENNNDWYDLQKEFSPVTYKVMYKSVTGEVIGFAQDASLIFPIDGTSIIEIEQKPKLGGYIYDDAFSENKKLTLAEQVKEINDYYNGRFDKLKTMILDRQMANLPYEDLQEQYKKIATERITKIKVLKGAK